MVELGLVRLFTIKMLGMPEMVVAVKTLLDTAQVKLAKPLLVVQL
jgi:hypothetical protein